MLLEQPREVQARVIADFHPKQGTRDINRLFQGFFKSVAGNASLQSAPKQVPMTAPDPRLMDVSFRAPFKQPLVPRNPSSWVTALPVKPMVAHIDLEAFVMQWGLDDSAMDALMKLDNATQGRVIEQFEPRQTTRDINRLFHGFLRSVTNTPAESNQYLLADGIDQAQYEVPFMSDPGVNSLVPEQSMMYPDLFQAEGTDMARIQMFLQSWNLDESSRVALMQMDPQVQLQIMHDFAPKPQTQDLNRLFHGFVRSVSARTQLRRASPMMAPVAPVPFMRSEEMARIAPRQPLLQRDDFSILTGGGAKRTSTWVNDNPNQDEILSFAQTWDLDQACISALQVQSPEVQKRVMDQFCPRSATRDVRNLFHGFIKSVVTGGGKRPRTDLPPHEG